MALAGLILMSHHHPDEKILSPRLGSCRDCRDLGAFDMTRRCELTGKLPLSGQLRSHAENKTKRKFRPNLVNVTLQSEALQRSFKLRVAASALKTVEHRGGLDAFLKKARNEELSEQCLKLKRDIAKAVAGQDAASA
jgi:large subunit ribosomal protein L28